LNKRLGRLHSRSVRL